MDLLPDILNTIINPRLIGRVGCTMMYMVSREMQTAVDSSYILRGTQLCDGLAADGCLDLLKWAREQRDPFPYCAAAATVAASAGHVHILKYLRANSLPGGEDQVSIAAAKNGHFNVLEWMTKHGFTDWCNETYQVAAGGGHLDILRYLYRARSVPSRIMLCEYAARKGRVNVLEWLCRHNTDGCSSVVAYAIKYNHPNVLDWWISRGGVIDTDAQWYKEALCVASGPIIDWLSSHRYNVNI